MTTAPPSCPLHVGFPAGRCARCTGDYMTGAPVSTMARMRPPTTRAESRARRLARDAEIAAQRDDDALRRELGVRR